MANLLFRKQKQKVRREYWMRIAAATLGIGALLAVLAAFFLLPANITIREIEAAYEANQRFVDRAQEVRRDDRSVQMLVEFRRRLAELDTAHRETRLSEIIKDIIAIAPSGLSLTRFSFQYAEAGKSTLVVGGVAPSREALQAFSRELLGISGVTNVDLPVSSLAADRNIEFTLTLSGNW